MYKWHNLLSRVIERGHLRDTRAGKTRAIFGETMTFNLEQGFPAVTTKKLFMNSVANELAGFLRAEQDASKMGSKIWEADTKRWYDNPLSSSKNPTDMGRIYGVQWRQWLYRGACAIDQLREVVDTIKTNPTDRRLLVTAWNPGELELMCLPPCHYAFQFFVEEEDRLSLIFHMRSVDVFLGLPFDIASYALLLIIVANETGLIPYKLIITMGDTHIYINHMDQIDTVLGRLPFDLPSYSLDIYSTIDNFTANDFKLHNYKHHPAVEAPLNVG